MTDRTAPGGAPAPDAPVMDERIAARRAEVRRQTRRRRLRRTLTVLVVVLAAVGAWVVDRSSVVALQDVQVTGVQRLTDAEVRAAAGLPIGTSTLRLPLAAARERVAALPAVAEVQVVRREPVVLEVRVTERTPVLRASSPGGVVVLDAGGVVFGPYCAACGDAALPDVVLSGAVPPAGEVVARDSPLGNAAAVATALRDDPRGGADLVAEVEVLRAPADLDGLALVLADGTQVLVGRADRLPEKLRALAAVRADLGERQAAVIDVRTPLAPVVRR